MNSQMPPPAPQTSSKVGILYDNISGNIGDASVGLSLKNMLSQHGVEFDELIPGRFNPYEYGKIIVGGGYLLRPSPHFFYDKFRITGPHILNACGVEGFPDDLQYLDEYAYVSVRSSGDRKKLGYLNREVKVVPCTSMLLEDLKNVDTKIRSPSIGIHLTPGFLDHQEEESFASFISELDLNPCLLPITHYQQDSLYLNRLRLKLPDSKLMPILTAQEIFTLIGKFDYFISMSLHGAIFAYVHKVPFVVIDREKTRNFMHDRGLEQYQFASLKTLKQALEALMRDPPDYSARVANDFRILNEHVNAITSILPKRPPGFAGGGEGEKQAKEHLAELNAQIHHLQRQTTGLADHIRALEQELSLKSATTSAYVKPILSLIELYSRRRDLQSAFPEVKEGDYFRLIQWARDAVTDHRDADIRILTDHTEWYTDNKWLGLGERIDALNAELYQAKQELSQAKKELADIRNSISYKFVKSFSSRLDQLMPDGTRRGTLRKTAIRSIRVLSEQGFRSFAAQAHDKISRREFTILDSGAMPFRVKTATANLLVHRLSLEELNVNLGEFLSDPDSRLTLPMHEMPAVSIVIATHNNAQYTFECVRDLATDTLPPCEVIIVDNASSDSTTQLLSRIANATIIKNSTNRFFGPACNQGAKAARGEYVLFLNSDAFVHPGCVSSLVHTMDSSPSIGAAGARLVSPEGRLREAGSIIWQDGSALAYGREDDPSKPEYCYRREVDYCSAACLIVRRDAFERLNGFDETFTPAYYEDTDLCMRLWNAGLRVVYQPLAVATHVEFSGSSYEKAAELMRKQQTGFRAKHRKALDRKPTFNERNIVKARDRNEAPRILVMDDCVPKPAEGSGYPRMFSMLKSMASLGYRVTLLPLVDPTPKQPETNTLTQMGIEVMWGGIRARDLLQSRLNYYDIVLISRPHNALVAADLARRSNPKAQLIYDAEALWHRREQLRRRLGLPAADPRFESEEAELSLIRSADYVLTVSEAEKRLVQERIGDKERVVLLGHPHVVEPTQTPFQDRHDLLFLAGFKSAPGPNDDATVHFAKTLLPRIQNRIPNLKFIVAGNNPPESVRRLASDSIIIIGQVKDLREIYGKARVFVAPIRFGAGSMWKVTEAMSHGLPCVLSTVAAEGVEITDKEEALIAHDENDFVEKTVQLYQDEALWSHVRERELQYVAENCNPRTIERNLDQLLKRVSRPSSGNLTA